MVWFLIPVVAGAVIAQREDERRRRRHQEQQAREACERERQRLEDIRRQQEEMERQRLENERQQREREKLEREMQEREERERRERQEREETQRALEREERERKQREEDERRQRELRETYQRQMEEQRRQIEEAERREKERLEAQRESERVAQEEREKKAQQLLQEERRQKEEAERLERGRQKKLEEELRQKEEAALVQQRALEEALARKQEQLRAELQREAEKERANLQQQHEESLRKQEAEKTQKKAELKKQEEEQNAIEAKMKNKLQAEEDLYEENARLMAKGICPNLFPTEEEWELAKARLVPGGKFHCAVAGVSGSGKSSLVNALRGIDNKDPNAARVGVVETTTRITAYQDIRPSYSQWVWYDVPGAGTLSVPAPQYFNTHGLFVFSLIIVVIDNRFTAQDIAILHQCRHFKIPSFIVRSKANQQIMNIMHQELGYSGDEDESDGGDFDDVPHTKNNRMEMIAKAKQILIRKTSENVKTNLEEAELDSSQRVYVLSARYVRLVVTGVKPNRLRSAIHMIDEEEMTHDLHMAVKDLAHN